VQWNKDSVADETILNDLQILSNGELKLEENINLNRVEFRPNNFGAQNNNNNRGGRTNNNQNNRGGGSGGGRTNNNNPRNNNNQSNRGRNPGGAKKY
jgi:hypothetical protein